MAGSTNLATGVAPSTPGANILTQYATAANRLKQLAVAVDNTNTTYTPSPGGVAQTQDLSDQHTENMLANGDFSICQRLATPATLTQGIAAAVASTYGGYVLDRWYLTCETAASADVKAQQVDETASGLTSPYSMQLSQANAATKRVACSQVLEYRDAYKLRSRNVTFQFQSKASTSRNLRAAIISCKTSSTLDTFTAAQRDIVNTWTSTAYSTGNFFKATSGVWTYTVVAVSNSLANTSAYAGFSISGPVPSDCQNLICIVWDEGGVAQNGTFNVMQAGLFDGQIKRDWVAANIQSELARCQRYFYGLASNSGNNVIASGAFQSTSSLACVLQWPVTMRAIPVAGMNSATYSHFTVTTFDSEDTSAGTNISLGNASIFGGYFGFTGTATPYEVNEGGYAVWNNSTGDVLWFDAEL